MLVVGDKEVVNGMAALRKRDGSRQDDMPVDEFIALARERIASRALGL
jgi:threonyl-tRNA synthetase